MSRYLHWKTQTFQQIREKKLTKRTWRVLRPRIVTMRKKAITWRKLRSTFSCLQKIHKWDKPLIFCIWNGKLEKRGDSKAWHLNKKCRTYESTWKTSTEPESTFKKLTPLSIMKLYNFEPTENSFLGHGVQLTSVSTTVD